MISWQNRPFMPGKPTPNSGSRSDDSDYSSSVSPVLSARNVSDCFHLVLVYEYHPVLPCYAELPSCFSASSVILARKPQTKLKPEHAATPFPVDSILTAARHKHRFPCTIKSAGGATADRQAHRHAFTYVILGNLHSFPPRAPFDSIVIIAREAD